MAAGALGLPEEEILVAVDRSFAFCRDHHGSLSWTTDDVIVEQGRQGIEDFRQRAVLMNPRTVVGFRYKILENPLATCGASKSAKAV